MEIIKILYATDLVQPSLNFLERLITVSKFPIQKIVLLSDSPLPRWIEKIDHLGCKAEESTLKGGSFAGRVLSTADEENVSLIIADLDKTDDGLIKGSIEKKLIKKSNVPVLITNGDNDNNITEKGIFDNLVFATDWSVTSQKALDYLINLNDLIEALDIVNVLNKKLTVKDIRRLKKKIEEIRSICLNNKIDAESHVYAGDITDEILLAAKDYNATSIIMGTGTQKTSIKDFFSCSVSCKIAEKASIPLLVVP